MNSKTKRKLPRIWRPKLSTLIVLILFSGPKSGHQFPGPWFRFFLVTAVTTPWPLLLLLLQMLLLLLLPWPKPLRCLRLLLTPYVWPCVWRAADQSTPCNQARTLHAAYNRQAND